MAELSGLIPLAILGGWSALDGTSVGQFMVSRPMISATLAGFLLGDPSTGLLVGLILEGSHLGELPIGGAKVPEPGPSAIPATAAAIWVGGAGGVAVGVAFGVIWSQLSGLSVTAQRRWNGVLTRAPKEGWRAPRQLSVRHWACILSDGVRGSVMTGVGTAAVALIPASLGGRWPFGLSMTVAFLLLPAFLAGGSVLGGWSPIGRKGLLFALGCIAGLVLGIVR